MKLVSPLDFIFNIVNFNHLFNCVNIFGEKMRITEQMLKFKNQQYLWKLIVPCFLCSAFHITWISVYYYLVEDLPVAKEAAQEYRELMHPCYNLIMHHRPPLLYSSQGVQKVKIWTQPHGRPLFFYGHRQESLAFAQPILQPNQEPFQLTPSFC